MVHQSYKARRVDPSDLPIDWGSGPILLDRWSPHALCNTVEPLKEDQTENERGRGYRDIVLGNAENIEHTVWREREIRGEDAGYWG